MIKLGGVGELTILLSMIVSLMGCLQLAFDLSRIPEAVVGENREHLRSIYMPLDVLDRTHRISPLGREVS